MTPHPCRSDAEAIQSAILDDDKTFIVEQILSHEIVNNKLNLRIKWWGYEQPELTGLNSTLQNNKMVQKILAK